MDYKSYRMCIYT